METGCSQCGERRRSQFSKNQLSKGPARRCSACVAASAAGKGGGASRAQGGAVAVDGSTMEGGGQVIRLSCSLAALLGTPLHLHSIRAKRSRPGLAAQHLTGLRLVAEMCGGGDVLTGAEVGATEVHFAPPTPPQPGPAGDSAHAGRWSATTGGAGSLMLVLQIALPVVLYHLGPPQLTLQLQGGTNVSTKQRSVTTLSPDETAAADRLLSPRRSTFSSVCSRLCCTGSAGWTSGSR